MLEPLNNAKTGGSCNKTCTEIRDAYVSNIQMIYPAAINLCPAPPDSANTFVSFSCLADGFWMLVTCIITLSNKSVNLNITHTFRKKSLKPKFLNRNSQVDIKWYLFSLLQQTFDFYNIAFCCCMC